jgi:hypothetical protein
MGEKQSKNGPITARLFGLVFFASGITSTARSDGRSCQTADAKALRVSENILSF